MSFTTVPAETTAGVMRAPRRADLTQVEPILSNGEEALPGMPTGPLTVLPTEPVEAGEGGKGGDLQITNSKFIAAVFSHLPEGAFAAVCSKAGNPDLGGWPCYRADQVPASLTAGNNNYLGCASFYPGDDGSFKARKAQFAACHFLLLDDLGTKVPLGRLDGFQLSWLIETSPGNYQGGIILARPLTDGPAAVRLLNAIIDSGLCDAGATGPLSRWARLPVGSTTNQNMPTKRARRFSAA
jgi:hypothetical protein